jgi:hypothetical protein
MIEPVLEERLEHSYSGLPHGWLLPAVSAVILLLAFLNHRFGVKKSGKPVGAVDHIHHAPGLRKIYDSAEEGIFDPYGVLTETVNSFSSMLFAIDRAIDWVYTGFVTGLAGFIARMISAAHTGRHWMYVLWTLAGGITVAVIVLLIGG